jgi:hypothetical protein
LGLLGALIPVALEPVVELSTSPPPLRCDDPELLGAPELLLFWVWAEAKPVEIMRTAAAIEAVDFLIGYRFLPVVVND